MCFVIVEVCWAALVVSVLKFHLTVLGNRLPVMSIISCDVFSKNVIFLTNSLLSNLTSVIISFLSKRNTYTDNCEPDIEMNFKNRAVFFHAEYCKCFSRPHI